jgi:hypothetical protein
MPDDDPSDRTQFTILDTLLAAYPAPMSGDELTRLLGDAIVVADALADLAGAGLAYSADDLWWATRPAWRFAVLKGDVHEPTRC